MNDRPPISGKRMVGESVVEASSKWVGEVFQDGLIMNPPIKINLNQKFSLFNDHWSPKIIGELNENFIKLVKFQGEFVWNSHQDEDELFIVIKGKLTIKFRDQDLTANSGEIILIPKGVEHYPCVEEELWAMVIEPKTVVNTGDVDDVKTAKNLERI